MSTQPLAPQGATTTTEAPPPPAAAAPPTDPKPKPAPQPPSDDIAIGFGSAQAFGLIQRVATMFAASSLVPKDFVNNVPNCVIALNMANRMGADPLMVMQNLYVVHGRPGWSSQFLIATFNQNGRFSAIRYKFEGKPGTDDFGCRAWSIEKATGEELTGALITVGLSKTEGWYERNGSKWKTMPEQMLMYRSASWFIRAYAPEIAMGLKTVDELQDIGREAMDEIISHTEEMAKLRAAIDAAPSKLDAVVDAAKVNGAAKHDEPPAAAAAAPTPETQTSAPKAPEPEKTKGKTQTTGKKDPAPAKYSEVDPGEDLFK